MITSAVERPLSPISKSIRSRREEDYYIQPASSSQRDHRRSYTANSIDTSRLVPLDRESVGRTERGEYRSSGGGRSAYNISQPLVRTQSKDNREYGFEYTDRREQMYGDTAPRARPRRDSYHASGRERPVSMTGLEDYLPRTNQPSRGAGPPVAMNTRGFANVGRSSSLRQGQRARDDEAIPRGYAREKYDGSPQRPSRAPVLHQPADEGYSSYREGSNEADAEHRRRHRPSFGEEMTRPKLRDPVDDQHDRSRRYHYPREHDTNEDRVRRARDEPSRAHDTYDDQDRRARDEPPRTKHDHESHGTKNDRTDDKPSHAFLSGVASAAVAGAAAEGSRHRHHRHRDHDGGERAGDVKEHGKDSDRGHLPIGQEPYESSSVSTEASEEKDQEQRERRRRRHKEKEEKEEGRKKDVEHAAAPTEAHALREQGSYERPAHSRVPGVYEERPAEDKLPSSHEKPAQGRVPGAYDESSGQERAPGSHERSAPERRPEAAELTRSTRHRHHRSRTHDQESNSSSSGDERSAEPKQRQVRLVTPSQEPREPDPPIKGILRPPRPAFPEDPTPVREGVAPLKDAGKKGIPPNARWTKIDRKLVNPEALELGNERFEERPEYVIVLRVLTKEEIENYAAKTQEIRGKRGILTLRHEAH